MKIVVLARLVPDLVEELAIDANGTALDTTWLRLMISEFDDHAIEQAILLKESSGGQVIVISPNAEGVDDMLFTASAKGADQIIKLNGDFESGTNNHALARALAQEITNLQPDLILTGVQAHTDMDGPIGPLLAGLLDFPYVGYVSGASGQGETVTVRKEYPGGLVAEMQIKLPAVLGIQAAEQPPRYVAISKIRQTMKTTTIDELDVEALNLSGGPTVSRMFLPETSEKATLISGTEAEIADRLIEIFKELGVL